MQPLEKSLRNKLERTVKDARDVAETAARAALEQLGVGEASPYSHLTDADRELRRKLRAHGRQLGDVRNAVTEAQEITRLIEEVAYEHWHRMLFARFLAENNLLMYPDPVDPVAVTLEECEELAADEGAANGWELAARFAARMLPQIFRPDSPVFQLVLPPEHEQKLEGLVADLSQEVFTASDSLGWVYQFWQAKRKKDINDSEVKIGARELPAVTQLFTEPYMVAFLLDNALGAWWVAKTAGLKDGKELRSGARQILKSAETEDELRSFFALPGVPLEYLRFVKQDDSEWTPAAGTFAGWAENLKEFMTLDPCCGSGHFLVAVFLMLVAMRMELENLSAKDTVDAVLRENIHGLELDQRCVELAAFALAFAAWTYPNADGYRDLPELHLACTGLAVSAKREEWLKLAGNDQKFRVGMGQLYDLFADAPVLGSLIQPDRLGKGSAFIAGYAELNPLLNMALEKEITNDDCEAHEIGVAAQGLAKASKLLAGKFHLIVTNVPYLVRGKQCDTLKNYCETSYDRAKNDLANVFLERCIELNMPGGVTQIVMPQNWLFQGTSRVQRQWLLNSTKWNILVKLGAGAFESISGEVVKAILFSISKEQSEDAHAFWGQDLSVFKAANSKAGELQTGNPLISNQKMQFENPDYRIVLGEATTGKLLNEFAIAPNGMHGGDSNRYRFCYWEISENERDIWSWFQTPVNSNMDYGGRENIFYWPNNGKSHEINVGARIQGQSAWGKKGVVVRVIGDLPSTLYTGELFDISCTPIIPYDESLLPAVWCFCTSPDYHQAVRQLDQKLNVTNATLAKVVFDLPHWQQIAANKFPNGLPKPYSDDPAQWIFHGYPTISDNPLQVAVARLLDYRWPAELDSTMELSDEARTLVKKSDELLSHADDDGIVCIPAVRGEMKAEDRLDNLLAAAYGSDWSSQKKSELLAHADHSGKSMETWLREMFFIQHCKLFQHRPFIWHIWDGLRDGFAALVNYHKLDYKTLETLIYTYLGDWISRQKQDIANSIDGAAEKLAAAEQLKKKLELILEGEAPYDIFVRWKSLNKQPIGWNPDLNDGVRLNIRPFLTAGVLRFNKKPQVNIAWDKDRGKDVESAPWYHLFNGDRINDHHLSLAEKHAAREGVVHERRK